jgi:hypothetical protein
MAKPAGMPRRDGRTRLRPGGRTRGPAARRENAPRAVATGVEHGKIAAERQSSAKRSDRGTGSGRSGHHFRCSPFPCINVLFQLDCSVGIIE